jgi:hypothetical protein
MTSQSGSGRRRIGWCLIPDAHRCSIKSKPRDRGLAVSGNWLGNAMRGIEKRCRIVGPALFHNPEYRTSPDRAARRMYGHHVFRAGGLRSITRLLLGISMPDPCIAWTGTSPANLGSLGLCLDSGEAVCAAAALCLKGGCDRTWQLHVHYKQTIYLVASVKQAW